jgi:lipopolysaccharide export system permease protein
MNVRTVTIGEFRAETGAAPTLDWITTLRPEDVAGALGDTVDVSPAEARRALGEGAALRTAAFYEMRLQRAWAAPIGSLVMLLLAAPVAMANFRGGSGSTTMAAVLAAGMLFLVMDGLLAALGESGAIPVILGAWAAPCIFAAIGLTVLLYQEG